MYTETPKYTKKVIITDEDCSLLKTDESMSCEDKMQKIDAEIEMLRIREFRIAQKNYKFIQDDQIFSAAKPMAGKIKLAECYSCRVVTFQKES